MILRNSFLRRSLMASVAASLLVSHYAIPETALASVDATTSSAHVSDQTFLQNLQVSIEQNPDIARSLIDWAKEDRPAIAEQIEALDVSAQSGTPVGEAEVSRTGLEQPPAEEMAADGQRGAVSSETAEGAMRGDAGEGPLDAEEETEEETPEEQPDDVVQEIVESHVKSFGDPAYWMKAAMLGGVSLAAGYLLVQEDGDTGDGSYSPDYPRNWKNPSPLPPPSYGDTPSYFETDEYNRNYALGMIGASEAYARKFSGEGVVLALLDDGIHVDHPEFKDRIVDPYNAVYHNEDMSTTKGHGTAVAGLMAAARDGEGIHGVAWSAQIMPLSMADSSGTFQAGIGGENAARAWRHAAHHGAKAINNSWEFHDRYLDNTSRGKLREIAGEMVDAARDLVKEDIVTVFSTGNADRDQPGINAALPHFHPELKSHWIAVGAIDRHGELSNGSNHCGDAAAWCMVAPGSGTYAPREKGYGGFSGTSAAAPHVTGAVGVLHQAFPYMTGEEIVQILFETADDIGPREKFGHGLLNLERATRPIGETRIPMGTDIAGAAKNISASSLRVSAAFGDGIGQALAGKTVMALDAYNRGYDVDLANLAARQSQDTRRDALHRLKLFSGLEERSTNTIDAGPFSITTATRLRASDSALGSSPYSRMSFSFTGSGYSMEASMNPDLGRSFGLRETGFGRAPMMDARSFDQPHLALMESGFGASFGFDMSDSSDLTLAAFSGNVAVEERSLFSDAPSMFGGAAQITQDLGDQFTIKATVGAVSEEGSLLGSVSRGAFGENMRSNTMFANLGGSIDISSRTKLTFTGSLGQTSFKQNGGMIRSGDDLVTSSFGVGLSHQDIFQDADALSLAVTQPLRVEAGTINLSVPTTRDMEGSIGYSRYSLSPQPSGRELNLQASYSFELMEGIQASVGAMHRFDANHVRGRQETLGMFTTSFRF